MFLYHCLGSGLSIGVPLQLLSSVMVSINVHNYCIDVNVSRALNSGVGVIVAV